MSNEKAAPIPEADGVELLTDAELDVELRAFGIDPNQLLQSTFQKVCELARSQSETIATLTAEVAALKAEIARRDAPVKPRENTVLDFEAESAYLDEIFARATPPQSDANLSCGCLGECAGHPSRTPPPQSGGKE